MRRSYVQRWRAGRWVYVDRLEAAPDYKSVAPYVMPDIKPYSSIITQEQIGSRSKHREHLKIHNCEEIGDNAPKWLRERHYEDKHGRRN